MAATSIGSGLPGLKIQIQNSSRQILHLLLEDGEMGFGIERFAGGALDQISGEKATAVGMDFLAEPFEKRSVVALI